MNPTSRTRGRLAAVWFADIVGYSELTAEDQNRALAAVDCLAQLAQRIVVAHGGRLVKFIGDAALAEFTSTASAVQAAIELQRAFAVQCAEQELDTTLRIAVHLGEIQAAPDGELYGDGVNVASRLQAEAAPGGVLVSEDVWRSLRGNPDVAFVPAGRRRLRGLLRPVMVYEVVLSGGRDGVPGVPLPRRRHGRRALMTGATVTAAGTLLLLLAIDQMRPLDGRVDVAADGAAAQRIAILYFDARQAGGDHEYLGAALPHDLIAALSGAGLNVVSRFGTASLGEDSIPVDSAARALSADAVLTGRIDRVRDSVRIGIELYDATQAMAFRARAASYPAHDLRAIRDGALRAAATLLRARYGRSVSPAANGADSDIAAWALTHRAEYLLERARKAQAATDVPGARDALHRADELLASAAAMTAAWPHPVLLRGQVAYERGGSARTAEEATRWIETGLRHAEDALRRDRGSVRALELRGRLRLLHHQLGLTPEGFDRTALLAAAGRDLAEAVQMDSSSATAFSALSGYLELRDSARGGGCRRTPLLYDRPVLARGSRCDRRAVQHVRRPGPQRRSWSQSGRLAAPPRRVRDRMIIARVDSAHIPFVLTTDEQRAPCPQPLSSAAGHRRMEAYMAKYLLLARDGDGWENFAAQATPTEIEACIGRYVAWSEKLREQGKLVASEKLKDGEGRVVRAERGSTRVTDGPHSESKEVIGGYWLMDVDSYEEGVQLLQDHPHLEFGSLELRAIETM